MKVKRRMQRAAVLAGRLLHREGRVDGAPRRAALDCGYSHGQRPTWRRHQYNNCRREGLEISCARADLGSCNDKETDLIVCMNWDGSALEDFFF